MPAGTKIEIVPSGVALGANVFGADLAQPLDDSTFGLVTKAFGDHSVLCFRDQDLSPDQFVAFSRRFSEPQRVFMNHYGMPDHPEILYISNVQDRGKDVGYADAGRVWHSDGSFERQPPWATMLHAKEVPVADDGTVLGDTLFASAVVAYDSLDEATKGTLRGLRVVHDVAGRRRRTGTGTKEDTAKYEAKEKVVHPLVRTHPYTGRKALYVSEGECTAIEGMDVRRAGKLIERLSAAIVRDDHIYRHRWAVGDVLIWDNCAVQHLAIHDYQPHQRRMMWRITVGHTDVYE